VLEAHVARGRCGRTVNAYDAFATALDDLWERPETWRDLGENGRDYVRREFANPAAYSAHWQSALDGIGRPPADQLRDNGIRRAKCFDRPAWRASFARVIERVLDTPPRTRQDALSIRSNLGRIDAAAGSGESLVPVRLGNRGRHPEMGEGFAKTELVSRTLDATGEFIGRELATPLPGLLLPGQDVAAMIRVAVPDRPGRYAVEIHARRPSRGEECSAGSVARVEMAVSLVAEAAPAGPPPTFAGPLVAAQAAQQLPDAYVDVSEGRFAKLKIWIKRKLLHNFQHAYVNVLSRQQSAFNRQVLAALAELADAQAATAHQARGIDGAAEVESLRAELRELRRSYLRLARRVHSQRTHTQEKAA